MMDQSTIRRAAILIANLERDKAESLLQRLDPLGADRIRQAAASLSSDDLQSSQAVIEEFLANYSSEEDAATTCNADFNAPAAETALTSSYSSFLQRPPIDLQFLYNVSPPLVAQFLATLHKQIAAVLLAHMPADLSEVILSYFSARQQSEILERINHSKPCNIVQLQTIVRLLKDCLMEIGNSPSHLPLHRSVRAGKSDSQDNFLNRTLSAMESNGTELSHLEYLHSQNRQGGPIDACSRSLLKATQAVKNETLRFEDLVFLNDNSLAKLFHQIDPQTLLLALAGAPTDVIQRITSPLTQQQASRFMDKLEQISGVSLRQIETAQQFVAAQATQMAKENTIQFIEQKPFHAAA